MQEGLRIGSDEPLLRQRAGEVMGLFAYVHLYLDGNGRTMLVVYTELCHRAGFCIDWHRTSKSDYLIALSVEIATPGKGILDAYLLPFEVESQERKAGGGMIGGLPGLDGRGVGDAVAGNDEGAEVSE